MRRASFSADVATVSVRRDSYVWTYDETDLLQSVPVDNGGGRRGSLAAQRQSSTWFQSEDDHEFSEAWSSLFETASDGSLDTALESPLSLAEWSPGGRRSSGEIPKFFRATAMNIDELNKLAEQVSQMKERLERLPGESRIERQSISTSQAVGETRQVTRLTISEIVDLYNSQLSSHETSAIAKSAIRLTRLARATYRWEEEHIPWLVAIQEFCQREKERPLFKMFFWVVLIFNITLLTMVANDEVRIIATDSGESDVQRFFAFMEPIFLLLYTIEIIIRIIGARFVIELSDSWLLMDVGIVVAGLLDIVIVEIAEGSNNPLSALRVVRLFRIFRLFKVLRLTEVARPFRVMTLALRTSLKDLFWVVTFLFMFQYAAAAFLTSSVGFIPFDIADEADPGYYPMASTGFDPAEHVHNSTHSFFFHTTIRSVTTLSGITLSGFKYGAVLLDQAAGSDEWSLVTKVFIVLEAVVLVLWQTNISRAVFIGALFWSSNADTRIVDNAKMNLSKDELMELRNEVVKLGEEEREAQARKRAEAAVQMRDSVEAARDGSPLPGLPPNLQRPMSPSGISVGAISPTYSPTASRPRLGAGSTKSVSWARARTSDKWSLDGIASAPKGRSSSRWLLWLQGFLPQRRDRSLPPPRLPPGFIHTDSPASSTVTPENLSPTSLASQGTTVVRFEVPDQVVKEERPGSTNTRYKLDIYLDALDVAREEYKIKVSDNQVASIFHKLDDEGYEKVDVDDFMIALFKDTHPTYNKNLLNLDLATQKVCQEIVRFVDTFHKKMAVSIPLLVQANVEIFRCMEQLTSVVEVLRNQLMNWEETLPWNLAIKRSTRSTVTMSMATAEFVHDVLRSAKPKKRGGSEAPAPRDTLQDPWQEFETSSYWPSKKETLSRLEKRFQFKTRSRKVQDRLASEEDFVKEMTCDEWSSPSSQSTASPAGHRTRRRSASKMKKAAVLQDLLQTEFLPWLADRASPQYRQTFGVKPPEPRGIMPNMEERLLGKVATDNTQTCQEHDKLCQLAASGRRPLSAGFHNSGLARALQLAHGSHVGRWQPVSSDLAQQRQRQNKEAPLQETLGTLSSAAEEGTGHEDDDTSSEAWSWDADIHAVGLPSVIEEEKSLSESSDEEFTFAVGGLAGEDEDISQRLDRTATSARSPRQAQNGLREAAKRSILKKEPKPPTRWSL